MVGKYGPRWGKNHVLSQYQGCLARSKTLPQNADFNSFSQTSPGFYVSAVQVF